MVQGGTSYTGKSTMLFSKKQGELALLATGLAPFGMLYDGVIFFLPRLTVCLGRFSIAQSQYPIGLKHNH